MIFRCQTLSKPPTPVLLIKTTIMKLNWGNGIFIFYVLFVGALVFQLVKSFQYDHSLVVDDYYQKDIEYQKQFDKLKNTKELSEPLRIKYLKEENQVKIVFPEDITTAKGEILFYRANDKSKDFQLPIENAKDIFVPTSFLVRGEWTVSVDWVTDDVAYFEENNIQIL